MSWPKVRLKDICDLQNGYAFKSSDYVDDSNTLSCRMSNIRPGGVFDIDYNARYLPDDFADKYSQFLLKDGDVIIAMTDLADAPKILGVPTVVGTEGRNVLLNQRVGKLVIKDSQRVHFPYLKLALNYPKVRSVYKRFAGGGLQINLGKNDLLSVEIPLPPLEEQKRIAAILDKADSVRRKRQQAIDLADDFLRSVFLDMFGDPILNPKGLPQVKLTELSDVISGYAFKSAEYIDDGEDSVRLCRGANTLTGYFDWKDTVYWNKEKLAGIQNYKIKSGDVILAMDRPWISSGLKVCVFPENERDTYLVQRVARIRPKNPKYTDFLYASILSKAFEKHCCPTETTVPHISPVELKNFNVLVPDEKLVEKYHDAVVKVRKSKLAMQKSAVEASNAFNSLSQKSFAGEL